MINYVRLIIVLSFSSDFFVRFAFSTSKSSNVFIILPSLAYPGCPKFHGRCPLDHFLTSFSPSCPAPVGCLPFVSPFSSWLPWSANRSNVTTVQMMGLLNFGWLTCLLSTSMLPAFKMVEKQAPYIPTWLKYVNFFRTQSSLITPLLGLSFPLALSWSRVWNSNSKHTTPQELVHFQLLLFCKNVDSGQVALEPSVLQISKICPVK